MGYHLSAALRLFSRQLSCNLPIQNLTDGERDDLAAAFEEGVAFVKRVVTTSTASLTFSIFFGGIGDPTDFATAFFAMRRS